MNNHQHSRSEPTIVSRLGDDEQMAVTFPHASLVIVAFGA